jgi:DNA-binding transcriptional ArsR family regulator
MDSIEFKSHIRDVMPSSPALTWEIKAAAPFELLVGLYAFARGDVAEGENRVWLPASQSSCSPAVRRALAEVGDGAGESWLHLLGLALEHLDLDATAFAERVADVPALELRRHLVGVHVPAWRAVAGAEMLERAAAGDEVAAAALLANPRYYGGRARESLGTLIGLSPRETKRRLVAALRLFAKEIFAARERVVMDLLEHEARAQRSLTQSLPLETAIAAMTGGYIYEPEPELPRVILVPHLAARPWLLLCQHDDARIICYAAHDEPQSPEADLAARALRLGRALGDERRVRMLRRLAAGEATLAELADVGGIGKPTAHHHLAALRAAGFVTMRGNARGYWYSLRLQGSAEAQQTLGQLLVPSQSPSTS